MKNRSKMILGLASMLGISAGAAAVSGFAWFTTQRTADISASNFVVGASEGSLQISSVADKFVNCSKTTDSGNVLSINPSTGKLEDVSSGDGKNFYKALLTSDGTALDRIVKETGTDSMSLVNEEQMVKVSWEVKVENTASGTDMNVFLSNDGPVFKQNSDNSKKEQTLTADGTTTAYSLPIAFDKVESVKVGDTELAVTTGYTVDQTNGKITFTSAPESGKTIKVVTSIDYSKYYRLAIYDLNGGSSEDTETLVYFYANSSYTKYINATTNTTRDGEGDLKDDTDAYISTSAKITKSSDTAASTSQGVKASNQLLIKGFKSTKAHTLRFVVWCEGTATPDKAVVEANSVDLNLGLVALTA